MAAACAEQIEYGRKGSFINPQSADGEAAHDAWRGIYAFIIQYIYLLRISLSLRRITDRIV